MIKRLQLFPYTLRTTMSCYASSKPATAPQAAICVIGNEVLRGSTLDTNSNFIAKLLFSRGIDLTKIMVIPDDKKIIMETVSTLSKEVGKNGFVFTTGGIGPTHDDITYESIASAFDLEVKIHEATKNKMKEYMSKKYPNNPLNADRLRMATLPDGCDVLWTPDLWVPLAIVHNVYILPGIPILVKKMLTANAEHFRGGIPIYRNTVYTLKPEGDIATALRDIQKEHTSVFIGSYVNLTHFQSSNEIDDSYKTKLVIDGRDFEEVQTVAMKIAKAIDGEIKSK